MHVRDLGRKIKAQTKGDNNQRAAEARAEVESLLASDHPPLVKEVWRRMRGWYKESINRPLPLAHVNITRMTMERISLYKWVPPIG